MSSLLPASHLPASSGQDIGRPLEADLAEADGGGAGARRQGVERPRRGQDQRRPRPAQGRPQGEKKCSLYVLDYWYIPCSA